MAALESTIAAQSPYVHYACHENDATYKALLDRSGNGRNLEAYTSYVDLGYQRLGPYLAHRFKPLLVGADPLGMGVYPFEMRRMLPSDSLLIVGDATVSFLIKFNATPAGTYRFFSIDYEGETLTGNVLFQVWFAYSGSDWKFYAFHEYSTGVNVSAMLGPALVAGQTYHIVFRRNTATKTWSLFVDGVKYDSAYSDNPATTISAAQQFLKVGGSSTDPSGHDMDDSAFSQLAIWLRAIQDLEVQAQYDAWLSDISAATRTISGIARLDGAPVAATMRLYEHVSGELRATTESAQQSGYYAFSDSTGAVMSAGEEFVVVCDYGPGVRPLAHGPITPSTS